MHVLLQVTICAAVKILYMMISSLIIEWCILYSSHNNVPQSQFLLFKLHYICPFFLHILRLFDRCWWTSWEIKRLKSSRPGHVVLLTVIVNYPLLSISLQMGSNKTPLTAAAKMLHTISSLTREHIVLYISHLTNAYRLTSLNWSYIAMVLFFPSIQNAWMMVLDQMETKKFRSYGIWGMWYCLL